MASGNAIKTLIMFQAAIDARAALDTRKRFKDSISIFKSLPSDVKAIIAEIVGWEKWKEGISRVNLEVRNLNEYVKKHVPNSTSITSWMYDQ